MSNTANITEASLELLLELAEDAGNWSGMPPAWVTKAQRGNLTQLKKAGLLETTEPDERGDAFVIFTAAGKALAGEHGVDVSWIDLWIEH